MRIIQNLNWNVIEFFCNDFFYFYIDIYDEAFTQAKEAAEVWVGDDENRIPVRVRAKLKIGAAEVYLRDATNTRYPLRCKIELPH